MLFNLVTPCARPGFLDYIYDSIEPFVSTVKWYIVYDSSTTVKRFNSDWIVELNGHIDGSVAGHHQRNLALDLIKEGWVYQLDDDNILHPYLIPEIAQVTDYSGVTFDQVLENRVRAGNDVRETHIDQAQFILKRELIGASRYNIYNYCADGEFIEAIYKANRADFLYLRKELCYYNRLVWQR